MLSAIIVAATFFLSADDEGRIETISTSIYLCSTDMCDLSIIKFRRFLPITVLPCSGMLYVMWYIAACYKPPSFDDAVIDVISGNLLKQTVIFRCIHGYLLEGDPSLVCQADGFWSTKKFSCRGELKYQDELYLSLFVGHKSIFSDNFFPNHVGQTELDFI